MSEEPRVAQAAPDRNGETPTPIVSVLTTAYNRERYVGEAIESVLKLDGPELELIVVDDGSRDRTVEIARSHESDPRLRVFINEHNLGDYPNRNRAAEHARGKYLKYLDADDKMLPGGLAAMVEALESHPNAALALCSDPVPGLNFPAQIEPEAAYRLYYLEGAEFFDRSPMSAIIRADAFRQLGGFKPARHTGDQDLWLRLAARHPLVLMPKGLAWYRLHDEQESKVGKTSGGRTVRSRLEVTLRALNAPECPLSDADRRRVIANLKRIYARRILREISKLRFKAAREMLAGRMVGFTDFARALGPKPRGR